MPNFTASTAGHRQPQGTTPIICHAFELLYTRVTSPAYTHDTNPWSDSDPELQSISTAALELLQEHADFHMQVFLYIHELLDRELADRKLASRARLNGLSLGGSRVLEVIFDAEDLEPLSHFLSPRDDRKYLNMSMVGERIDTIAKMAYAWVDGDRSASSARRRRIGSSSPSVATQAPRDAAMQGALETGDSDQGDQCTAICTADLVQLEAEMNVFDAADARGSCPEMECTVDE